MTLSGFELISESCRNQGHLTRNDAQSDAIDTSDARLAYIVGVWPVLSEKTRQVLAELARAGMDPNTAIREKKGSHQ